MSQTSQTQTKLSTSETFHSEPCFARSLKVYKTFRERMVSAKENHNHLNSLAPGKPIQGRTGLRDSPATSQRGLALAQLHADTARPSGPKLPHVQPHVSAFVPPWLAQMETARSAACRHARRLPRASVKEVGLHRHGH